MSVDVDVDLVHRVLPAGAAVAVTGAGSGLGRAVVQTLAGASCRIYAIDVSEPALHETRELVGRDDAAVELLPADVTDDEAIHEAIASAVRAAGRVDALVNCVGITGITGRRSAEVPLDDFDRVVRLNLRAALSQSQAVLPHMVERGYGRILHVASIAGKEGNAGMAAYSASKAGVIGLVKSMGKEYAETGVTVNALAPAVIRTPMVASMPAEQVKYMTDRIPMKRCGELEEAAKMISWIVGPDCSFTTGFTFDLSGGRAVY